MQGGARADSQTPTPSDTGTTRGLEAESSTGAAFD